MGITIQRAKKTESFLRMSIAGPAKSGKTFSSLAIAKHLLGEDYLSPETGIVLIDTERKSSLKYADIFTFDFIPLDDYSPDNYLAGVDEAVMIGKKLAIIDSLSHAWFGKNGVLEIVDEEAAKSKTHNTFAAWRVGTPKQNELVDCMTGAPIHIIATMRSKQEYLITNDNGKQKIEKVGLAPVQREGIEYEFDVPAEMDMKHRMIISNSRCFELDGKSFVKPAKDVADILRKWLAGAPMEADKEKLQRIENARASFIKHHAENKYNEILQSVSGVDTVQQIPANRVDAVLAKIEVEYRFLGKVVAQEKVQAPVAKAA